MLGRVVGFEINSQEPEKAAPNGDYWPVTTGQKSKVGINGGISKGQSDYPHGTRIQMEVDAIDEVIEQATSNGATILREKMEFDDLYLAYLVYLTGIGIGLIQHKNNK